MTPTNVYALFVGINDYDPDLVLDRVAWFPALSSCINDITAMQEMLERQQDLKLHALVLKNEEATKERIVTEFEKHLGKAGPDDVVLFYYSGHGTVELADTAVWNQESGTRFECLVCYYDQPTAHNNLLADKELRYLLGQTYRKTKAHIVVIADCCHSGDNTRAAVAGPQEQERQGRFKPGFVEFPARPWNEFIFHPELAPEHFRDRGLDEALPPVPHVQIAACERTQVARESRGYGVLSFWLLHYLHHTGGNLSYRDLMSRIRNQVKYLHEQRPRLYTPPGTGIDLDNTGFLKKPVGAEAREATLIYNAKAGEYRLNRGVQHRVEAGLTTVTVVGTDGLPATGLVSSADLDASVVSFSLETLARVKRATQPATIDNLSRRVLRIHLINKDLPPSDFERLMKAINTAETESCFAFEDDPERADYVWVLWRGMAYFTEPGAENLFRPLILPVNTAEKNAGKTLAAQLQHMSQWTYVTGLRNEGDNSLPENSLRVEFFEAGEDGAALLPLDLKDNTLRLSLELREVVSRDGRKEKKWRSKPVKVKITNQSGQKLNIAALYSSYDFSVETTTMLHPAVTDLPPEPDPDAFKWLLDHKTKSQQVFGLTEMVRFFNWPESADSLKILFSTEPFDQLSALEMPPLPSPLTMTTRQGNKIEEEEERGTRQLVLEGWNALDFRITVVNPLFDRPDKDELLEWLKEDHIDNGADADLAHFLLGLYFEPNGPMSSKLVLKPGFVEGEKAALESIWWDMMLNGANRWAGFWRNKAYKKQIKTQPGLQRLVSEGDSWFQHPSLSDIIDHVSRFYPVHCLAAAGDTIRNWAREGDVQSTVAQYRPALLLLSGGGNDILGESLSGFLNDTYDDAPDGERVERFFKPAFLQELDALVDNYRTLFKYFTSLYPDMFIIVHGYDYPRPLPADSKKTSWLGKYFTQKNILREKDRNQAVRFMMDQFNQQLASAAAEYPERVHYLDLRGIVRDDQWNDEIHPDNDGFQDISQRFIRKIAELLHP
ncbi:MAG: caspase family protein [Saprospiraceae bacterium]